MDDTAKKCGCMNIFKPFTLKWWQTGLFKWGILALGIVLGTIWHEFFNGILAVLIILAVASLGYIVYEWWKQ